MWRYQPFSLLFGYLLDLAIGDPLWLPHPVRFIGWGISKMEALLRGGKTSTPQKERAKGLVLAFSIPALAYLVSWAILWAAKQIHPILGFFLEGWFCFQILAVHSLWTESMRVWKLLLTGDTEGARHAVSMIVGRDTQCLDEKGIIKAAIETVAENTGDGVIAPLFFMALGGAPLGFCYKAISTLDSMVGYRNEKYRYFGTASARLDDLVNFIPARLSGILLIAACPLWGLDAKNALKIFLRDRKKHDSPNSAHPEAACAGALGIALAGDAYYGGELHHKPVLGDDLRPVEANDILQANRLMATVSAFMMPLSLGIRFLLFSLI